MKHGGNVWEGGDPGRWLDFSANLRPEGPAPWAVRAMERGVCQARYYPDRDMRAARAGLAAWLGVPEKNVLPTAGGAAAIDLALSMREGRVLIEGPTFGEYAERARVHGRTVAEGAQAARTGDTLVLCNPNNPTGRALEREEALKKWRGASERGGELLVDEAFVDFCPGISVRGAVCESLTVVGSMTKILGVPGVRLGYVCGCEETIAALEYRSLPWALGACACAVAEDLPLHRSEIEADVRTNEERRERFAGELRAMGIRVFPSRTNFILADFRQDMTEVVSNFYTKGILVRVCASFGLGANYLRLAVKTEEENQRLIEELRTCLGC